MQRQLYLVNNRQRSRIPFFHNVTLGRDIVNSIPVQDKEVSRSHVLIEFVKPGDVSSSLIAHDLNSRNGLYVNGRRVKDAEVQPGDEIVFGATVAILSPNPQEDFKQYLTATGRRVLRRIDTLLPFEQEQITALSLPELEMLVDGRAGGIVDGGIDLMRAARLADAVCELSAVHDATAFYQTLLASARDLVGADEGVVMLREGDADNLQVRAHLSRQLRHAMIISQNVMRIALHAEKAFFSPDTKNDVRLIDFGKETQDDIAHTLLAIPIGRPDAKTAGFLYLEREDSPNAYGRPDLTLLYTLMRPALRLADAKGFLPGSR